MDLRLNSGISNVFLTFIQLYSFLSILSSFLVIPKKCVSMNLNYRIIAFYLILAVFFLEKEFEYDM